MNNPLRYVDPTGEDWWNPFSWIEEVGKALSAFANAIVGILDIVMNVIGFIPGLDVISDLYFLGKALVDVALGRGSWADVAMNAAALLLPPPAGVDLSIPPRGPKGRDRFIAPTIRIGLSMPSRRKVFKVVLEPAEDEPTDWYTATSPSLPGLVTQGKGLDAAVANVKDAISAYFDGKPPSYSLEVRVVVPV